MTLAVPSPSHLLELGHLGKQREGTEITAHPHDYLAAENRRLRAKPPS